MINTLNKSYCVSKGVYQIFADPRALHYENGTNTINMTYIGYIDIHGNIKATQYNWLLNQRKDILIRSYFQPDDHNNPMFLVLPDERVIIFYTRHTDEHKIWYRVSQIPGDISVLGEEKYLRTSNNTTYPSPFILSDDSDHIYLCWRGINWHPTIARITLPNENDDCYFDFGPKQIIQSTGARPYTKYCSNGKDKIYMLYTTGHPDNEMPNWLYLNVININHGNDLILQDIKGNNISNIANLPHKVYKSDDYLYKYPVSIIDHSKDIRNWVGQVVLDSNENPFVVYTHVDDTKTNHEYWYAHWDGTNWNTNKITDCGHAFHQNWNKTEKCFSGGLSIDKNNVVYLSIPNKNGIFEIWKHNISDNTSEQITTNSHKNNVRPFVIKDYKNSLMKLCWLNGDYYYWMINKNYPKGYETSIYVNYEWKEPLKEINFIQKYDYYLNNNSTTNIVLNISNNYSYNNCILFTIYNDDKVVLKYIINNDYYPVVKINNSFYKSQNSLLSSDNWALKSYGTNGDYHPTKLTNVIITLTFDENKLIIYRNGFIDQVININENICGKIRINEELKHISTAIYSCDECLSSYNVRYIINNIF